jgi:adenylate cyclase
MFNRYVSPDVVEELMANPDSVSLGGRRQLITVMFCDIRGFTAYSENKDPEVVVNRLNEYLTALTQVIFRHGGTLDKYLGDGLMALFGAPVFYPDHVQRAIQVAIEMLEEVEKLNQVYVAKGQTPLKVGVGINSGTVLVGNVGSPERMDYTVIGEDVNLASRVEGLTKNFNTMIVISERSVRMLEDVSQLPWELQHLGHAEVKGFTAPVEIYTVAGHNY